MTGYRCKCGKSTAWGSGMIPSPCHLCPECGSTLAGHPDHHDEPVEHDWEPRFDERTGQPTTRVCRRCYEHEGLGGGF